MKEIGSESNNLRKQRLRNSVQMGKFLKIDNNVDSIEKVTSNSVTNIKANIFS